MPRYLTDGKRHLICVPYSIHGLHEMATALNIKRCWFHGDHYDIPKLRKTEIEAQCEIVRPRDILIEIQKPNPIRENHLKDNTNG
jgi:hypothetical protein